MTRADKITGAWEVYLYARDLLAKRMSYGMVAQSMLLIAFSTLATGRAAGGPFIAFFQTLVATLGIIYTGYMFIRVRAIHARLEFLEQTYLLQEDLVFAEYLTYQPRQKLSRDFGHVAIIVIFLVTWLAMLGGAIFLAPPVGSA